MLGGIRRWAAIAGAALLVVACSGDVGEVIDGPPELGPLVDERELWRSTDTDAISLVSGASLHGDTALLLGGGKDGPGLSAVDAATGKPRWHLQGHDPLPGGDGTKLYGGLDGQDIPVLEDPTEGFLVFVPYISFACTQPSEFCQCANGRCEEVGIAALSGKDASVRWVTPISAVGSMQRVVVVPRAVSDDLVVVGIDDPFSDDLGSLRTVALNTSDGSRRWERPGVVADFISGETVIGRTPRTRSDVSLTSRPGQSPAGGTLVAMDATSGQGRWDLSELYADSAAELVAGNLVLVRAETLDEKDAGVGPDQSLIVEAGTGLEVANLGDYIFSCATDTRTGIACANVDDKLVSVQVHDHEIRVSRRPVESGEGFLKGVHGMWSGRVLVEYAEKANPQRAGSGYIYRHLAVDRSANVVDDRLPGPMVAISDRYAIFHTDEAGNVSVHAVTP
jgi:hypothetical protein